MSETPYPLMREGRVLMAAFGCHNCHHTLLVYINREDRTTKYYELQKFEPPCKCEHEEKFLEPIVWEPRREQNQQVCDYTKDKHSSEDPLPHLSTTVEAGETEGLCSGAKHKHEEDVPTAPPKKCKTASPEKPAKEAPAAFSAVQKRFWSWSHQATKPVLPLQQCNPIQDFDDSIVFEEEDHVYTVNDFKYRGSITGVLKSFFVSFDSDAISQRIAKSPRSQNDYSYEYYGMSKEAILSSWKTKAQLGSLLHCYIECFYNGLQLPPDIKPSMLGPEYLQFHLFHLQHVADKLQPFRSELRVAHPLFELVGSIDMLFRRKENPDDDHLIMFDWKRSKKLYNTSFEKGKDKFGKGPCFSVVNCKLNHCFLQLNLYKFVIEETTSYRIDEMYLAVFHPDSKYEVVLVPNWQSIVYKMAMARRFNLIEAELAKANTLQALLSEEAAHPSNLHKLCITWKHLIVMRASTDWGEDEETENKIRKQMNQMNDRVMGFMDRGVEETSGELLQAWQKVTGYLVRPGEEDAWEKIFKQQWFMTSALGIVKEKPTKEKEECIAK